MIEHDYAIRTILMSDVVGSTRLWAAHPDFMPTSLARMEAIAESCAGAEGGRLIKARGEGDSLFCVFPHPAAAARAAVRLKSLMGDDADVPLSLRIAIHCGPAYLGRDDDVLGPVPNRCARLRETAHPGQILMTGSARSLIGPTDGLTIRELGRHRLRDLDEPESVYQVVDEGQAEEFPPIRSLTALRNNLPLQRTSFVGRRALRQELRERLQRDRLITLTGAGGCGKTRLALQLGAESIESFPDGVWFVELAELSDETSIVRAVGDACGQTELADSDPLRALADRISLVGRSLFVLDNAEHILGPAGRVVSMLLAKLSEPRFIITSREPLHMRGERVYRVPPLSVPPAGTSEPATVLESESGAMFLDRARLHLPEFNIEATEAGPVCEIVRRLDGIPLCVEMAASHVGYLGVAQIAARLNDRFALLEGDDADAPPRHRTMRETIAWQVDTLKAEERLLLQRLSVFAGGFSLEAAESVGGSSPLSPAIVIRHLRTLVEKSLVVAITDDGQMRYRLLETIGQFAAEIDPDEVDRTMAAFVDWALATAKACEGLHSGPKHAETVALLDRSLPSIHRALAYGLLGGDERMAELVLAVAPYWFFKGLYLEGRSYLGRTAQVCAAAPRIADVYSALGAFCNRVGDVPAAEEAYRRGLSVPDLSPKSRGRCLANLGIVLNDQGRFEEALALYDEAIGILSSLGDEYATPLCRYNRTLVLLDLGRLEESEADLLLLIAHFESCGDSARLARCEATLGMIELQRDHTTEAARHFYDAVRRFDVDMPADVLIDLLIEVATVAARSGDLRQGALLLAAHQRRRTATGSRYSPRMQRQATWLEAVLSVDDPEVQSGRLEGRSITDAQLKESLAEVLKNSLS